MMQVETRPAALADIDKLDRALRQLSRELGDTHRATAAAMEAGLSREDPPFRAIVADAGDELAGAIIFSPVYSTVRGAAGLYVSDLWVSPEIRSGGMGRRLLSAAYEDGAFRWGASFIKLTVYRGNDKARAFYERLGFEENPEEIQLSLSGEKIAPLEGE